MSVTYLICFALNVYVFLIFARILLSWFPLDPDGTMAAVAGFLFVVTDPVLGPLRRVLPPVRLGGIGLDLSPMIAILGIVIVQGLIC
ncbi:MAG: YggT family protein [Actinomyces sp.]|nr:MAG: YggT family protein [Actinomyces sp.]